MGLNVLNFKWFISIHIIFVLLSANCWSDNITSTNSSTLPDKSQKAITIQVSSHKKAEDADSELQRLKSHGLDSFIDYELVKDKGMWYRVYVGQFESKKAATAFANGLVGKGIISGFWVKKKIISVTTLESPEENQPKNQEPTIEVQKSQVKTEIDSIFLPSPPSPAEESNILAPSEISKPKEIEIIAPKKATLEPEAENIATSSATTAKSDQGKNKFSMGLKSSLSMANRADEFKITKSSGGDINSWSFSGTNAYVGFVANLRLNDNFTIESSIERDFMTEIDIWQLSVGPIYHFSQIGLFTPYARACLVIGDLKLDDAPGNFDTGLGLEGGIGIYFIKSKVQLGIETSYRRMKYNYNKPSSNEVSATDDHIDMSGFIFSGTLSYLF